MTKAVVKTLKNNIRIFWAPYLASLALGVVAGQLLGLHYLTGLREFYPIALSLTYPIFAFLLVEFIDEVILARIKDVEKHTTMSSKDKKIRINLNSAGNRVRRNWRRGFAFSALLIFLMSAFFWVERSDRIPNEAFIAYYLSFHFLLKFSIAVCAAFLLKLRPR